MRGFCEAKKVCLLWMDGPLLGWYLTNNELVYDISVELILLIIL